MFCSGCGATVPAGSAFCSHCGTPAQSAPSASASPQRSWFGRNWKWLVPTLVLLVFLGIAGLVAGVLGIAMTAFKSSDVYVSSLERVRTAPAVVQQLGQPIEDGWLVTGSIEVAGPGGHADIAIPIHGPKGKATVYAVAEKSAGRWEFHTLQVAVEGRPDRLDLLQ